ncbi:response regulator transcription factor [Cohnella hongkongensis]|uniref:Response regulator n=1 Tax=Cohnella hongkongensis TaxID=178337 RepID=A0ABV9FD51_9BACL
MYQVLLVDDEYHAIQGLQSGVNWDKFGIGAIHAAYNIRQAKEVLNNHPVDFMICDIEMPEGSGIELLRWVREHYPDKESVFLTCHSDFGFAKQAIQLGSLDYLLKPVRYSELEKVIEKALDKVEQKRQQDRFNRTYDHYYRLWKSHEPLLVERFWQDLLSRNPSSIPEELRRTLSPSKASYTEQSLFRPVLVRVQRWHRTLSTRDEKIIEYGIRNAVAYSLIPGQDMGQVIRRDAGLLLAILPWTDSAADTEDELRERCRSCIAFCSRHLFCDVSLYVGHPSRIQEMAGMLDKLLVFHRRHAQTAGGEYFLEDSEVGPPDESRAVVDKVRRFIAEHLDQPLTRKELAQHVYLNPDYLAKLFKKTTGIALTDYVVNERMRLAKEMLERGGVPIGAIASAVGYSSFSYFSKTFKTQYGVTPQEFRERL